MTYSEAINRTHKNMQEKLEWAERSLSRMDLAKKSKNLDEFQDHFWSFIHAFQLIFFYLGEHQSHQPPPRLSAKEVIENWKEKNLIAEEIRIWSVISDLRTCDVHTEPVSTKLNPAGHFVFSIAPDQWVALKISEDSYVVNHKGEQFDAVDISRNTAKLLRRFVEAFPQLKSTNIR